MEQLIKLVKEKTGITETQATTAVTTVVSFLKEKLPAGLSTQVDSFLKGDSGNMADMAGGIKDKLGEMFNK